MTNVPLGHQDGGSAGTLSFIYFLKSETKLFSDFPAFNGVNIVKGFHLETFCRAFSVVKQEAGYVFAK